MERHAAFSALVFGRAIMSNRLPGQRCRDKTGRDDTQVPNKLSYVPNSVRTLSSIISAADESTTQCIVIFKFLSFPFIPFPSRISDSDPTQWGESSRVSLTDVPCKSDPTLRPGLVPGTQRSTQQWRTSVELVNGRERIFFDRELQC